VNEKPRTFAASKTKKLQKTTKKQKKLKTTFIAFIICFLFLTIKKTI